MRGIKHTEPQRRASEYCSYKTESKKLLRLITLTTNNQEYGKKETDANPDQYSFMVPKSKRQQNSNNIKIKTELQLEIECLRCHDAMMLCSDFNDLYYFCEQCGFLLHTHK